jgi:hypothetical protein
MFGFKIALYTAGSVSTLMALTGAIGALAGWL